MRKTKRLAQNKDDLHNLGSDDLLSRLPDEVLVSILSSLPLRDAVVTSKLSRRWRYLWCQTDRLVFEDMERWTLMRNELYLCYSKADRNEYMSWVNHIIHQHKSPTIGEFKICFGLDENAKGAISKWTEFAISKDVHSLELDLTRNSRIRVNYSFNVPVMEIKFLKSLTLKFVDVDDEGLKKILSKCPVLEHLSVFRSHKLVKPEIYGKGLALKNLDMTLCVGLKSIEICDSNIVSLSYRDLPITFKFDNLQKLQKICMSKGYSLKKTNDIFCQISCCVPNLHVLELDLYLLQGLELLHPFPKLQKLKQLIIKVVNRDADALLVLPFLVEACPNLQSLTIVKRSWSIEGETNREVRKMAKKPHQHLEVVEIAEYHDGASDLELAMYFVQSSVALKKLVIKSFMKLELAEDEITDEEEENAARNRARQQLKPITPDGVELVIL